MFLRFFPVASLGVSRGGFPLFPLLGCFSGLVSRFCLAGVGVLSWSSRVCFRGVPGVFRVFSVVFPAAAAVVALYLQGPSVCVPILSPGFSRGFPGGLCA